jgi:hypothetical protein
MWLGASVLPALWRSYFFFSDRQDGERALLSRATAAFAGPEGEKACTFSRQ